MSESVLPSWADELRTRYQSGAASIFVVHGAIGDLQAWTGEDGTVDWVEPTEFLLRFLGRTRTAVVYRAADQLLSFSSDDGEAEILARTNLRRKARGLDPLGAWPTGPREVLPLLKEVLADAALRVAVVVMGVELLAPAESDRPEVELTRGRVYDLVYDAPAGLISGDGLLVFTADTVDTVDPRVRSAARVAPVVVPLPDFRGLKSFVEARLSETDHEPGPIAASLTGRTLREAGRTVARILRGGEVSESGQVDDDRVGLPAWADDLRERYLAGEASMFLVHGNVRDVYPWEDASGAVSYVTLRQFMERFLLRAKELVAYYNVSEGIEFPVEGMHSRFLEAINARRRKLGRVPRSSLAQVGDSVLSTFEELITGGDNSPSAAVILDYVEMVVPMGDLST